MLHCLFQATLTSVLTHKSFAHVIYVYVCMYNSVWQLQLVQVFHWRFMNLYPPKYQLKVFSLLGRSWELGRVSHLIGDVRTSFWEAFPGFSKKLTDLLLVSMASTAHATNMPTIPDACKMQQPITSRSWHKHRPHEKWVYLTACFVDHAFLWDMHPNVLFRDSSYWLHLGRTIISRRW